MLSLTFQDIVISTFMLYLLVFTVTNKAHQDTYLVPTDQAAHQDPVPTNQVETHVAGPFPTDQVESHVPDPVSTNQVPNPIPIDQAQSHVSDPIPTDQAQSHVSNPIPNCNILDPVPIGQAQSHVPDPVPTDQAQSHIPDPVPTNQAQSSITGPSPGPTDQAQSPVANVGQDEGLMQQEFIDAHNKIRENMGEPPLKWDEGLVAYAQNWAKALSGDCNMIHSNGPYGENLFWGESDHWTPTEVVQSWASESQYFDYKGNTCTEGQMCGHYTQVIWRKTCRFGCARQKCNNGGVLVVCNYDPPGNYDHVNPFDETN